MKKKRKHPKSFELEYDKTRQAMVLRILDSEGMYPCYWYDAKTDRYRKIIKTSNDNVQMI